MADNATKLQIRRDYDYRWLTVNPVLAEGEIGFVLNTNKIKIGDGVTAWCDLPYVACDSMDLTYIQEQINALKTDINTKADKGNVYSVVQADETFVKNAEFDEKAEALIAKIFNDRYYTKQESDARFAKEGDIAYLDETLKSKADKEDVDIRFKNASSRLETVEETLENKQDTLTDANAGDNIFFTVDNGNLRINALVPNTKQLENDIKNIQETKADKEYVDTELAKKADKEYVDGQLANKANAKDLDNLATKEELNDKADKSDLNDLAEIVDTKADKEELESFKSETGNVEQELKSALELKADFTTVRDMLATKADRSDVYTKDEVNKELAKKANTSDLADIDVRIDGVADKLALKADKEDLDHFAKDKADKSFVKGLVEKIDDINRDLATKVDAQRADYIDARVDEAYVLLNQKADKSDIIDIRHHFHDVHKELKNKQDKLVAGQGITITDNVISANIDLDNVVTKDDVEQIVEDKIDNSIDEKITNTVEEKLSAEGLKDIVKDVAEDVVGDMLDSKADKSELDSLEARVETLEDTADSLDELFNAKADKSDLDNLVSKDELETLDDKYALKVSVYTKEESDERFEKANENIVKYQDFEYNGEQRKTIQLANYDSISGVTTDGRGANLVMLSKWDVADFGSTQVHANINTSDNVTINDNRVIVTMTKSEEDISYNLEDIIEDVEEKITEVKDIATSTKSELELVQEKLQDVNFDNFVQLSDDVMANLEDGDILQWDGSEWVVTQLGTVKTWED